VLWGLSSPSPSDRSLRPIAAPEGLSRRPADGPAGDQVCRECHPIEALAHARSGHARTLRPAAAIDLAGWLDGRGVADPERPGVRWRYELRDGQLEAQRTEGRRIERVVLDFALGSGRHATTFVSLTATASGSPGLREHRLTYFARSRSLGLTPGQTAAELGPGDHRLGRDWSPEEAVRCFGCHGTTVSAHSPAVLDVATMRPGVGCERCHGPGAAHVAAARRGETDLAMPRGLDSGTAADQMRFCGACHRHPAQAPAGQIAAENPVIVRFQPVGLMQAKCYTRSDGALRCTTCHDPHARASTDRASYEAACLGCHRPEGPSSCPVSPRADCLGCHMPARDSGQGILFTDHWIRVRSDR
ncbi:MAG TPA: multiheme c-type cytochrome, partial [Isosphaeraceae bacterium]